MKSSVEEVAENVTIMPYSRKGRATDGSTALSRFVAKRLEHLAGRKTARQIAAEAGFTRASLNIVSMIKAGDSKLPLDKVPAMAKALEVDPVLLWRLAMEQYQNGAAMDAIKSIFKEVVSENEADIIRYIRELTDNADPSLTEDLKRKLEKAFA